MRLDKLENAMSYIKRGLILEAINLVLSGLASLFLLIDVYSLSIFITGISYIINLLAKMYLIFGGYEAIKLILVAQKTIIDSNKKLMS